MLHPAPAVARHEHLGLLGAAADPDGMHAIAVGNGTITIITDDDVHNIGPGNGIETESFNG